MPDENEGSGNDSEASDRMSEDESKEVTHQFQRVCVAFKVFGSYLQI